MKTNESWNVSIYVVNIASSQLCISKLLSVEHCEIANAQNVWQTLSFDSSAEDFMAQKTAEMEPWLEPPWILCDDSKQKWSSVVHTWQSFWKLFFFLVY